MIAALLLATAVPAATPAARAYAAALAPIGDCAAFAAAPALPDAGQALAALFAQGLPAPVAGEDDAAFAGRAVDWLFARLGDPGRLVLRLPTAVLPPPGRGGALVPLPPVATLPLDRRDGPARLVVGVPLATATEVRAELQFTAAATSPPVPVGRPLRVLAMFEDWGTDATTRPAAAGQAASQTSIRLMRLRVRCAVAEGAPGWRYEDWDE